MKSDLLLLAGTRELFICAMDMLARPKLVVAGVLSVSHVRGKLGCQRVVIHDIQTDWKSYLEKS